MSSSEPQQPHSSQAQPPQHGPQPSQQPQFAQPDSQQSWPEQAAQQQYQQAPQQSQQAPQYAQPQYAQHQHGQQGTQQQYAQPSAQPQYAQPQYAQPGTQPQDAQQRYTQAGPQQQRSQSAAGSLNVPGIIALVLLLLTTFIPLLTPALYRAAATSDSFSAISAAISGTNALLLIVAGALAVVGLVVRRLTRWRWAAIGAAVAVAVGFLSFVFSWVGGLVMGAPWFY
ncbi:hypothetical protein [Leucobacter chromiiresistens]|uniref:Uncharacterized protein n=1 Tax=Leucobacter chromiiresistens TaxID=1079994 RepID=A0A1H1BPF9_9MICO|nr:hypothetical protein [Leucobacter chromiiresistens]SDQ53844.1 hypothetical protein SAMN04488565_2957 [Leucobacter chromiiresistens]